MIVGTFNCDSIKDHPPCLIWYNLPSLKKTRLKLDERHLVRFAQKQKYWVCLYKIKEVYKILFNILDLQ